jgi:general L-amino acid transport system permease protein
MSNTTNSTHHYVRSEMLPQQAPPSGEVGPRKWIWDNLLSSMANFRTPGNAFGSLLMIALTAFVIWLIYTVVSILFQFAWVDAIFSGTDGSYCRPVDNQGKVPEGQHIGACWPFVTNRIGQFMNGFYPDPERWRIYVTYAIGAALIIPVAMPDVRGKTLNSILLFGVFPFVATVLLSGGNMEIGQSTWIFWAVLFVAALAILAAIELIGGVKGILAQGGKIVAVAAVSIFAILWFLSFDFGLPFVETSKWGGLMLTIVIGLVGIVVSLPLGIILALARRSEMPAVRLAATIFIEVFRGVPLITVLFMSSVMLPLFFPEGVSFDKLIRALIVVALFSSAYMAEVVRGGLQAIPKGQYEGAQALGLSFWQTNNLITMPQALKMVIPGIVNTFIGLFKDTTLVSIIGLYDFLGILDTALQDTNWLAATNQMTGFLFLATVYWLFTFSMSRYSIYTENRLHTGHKR